MTEIFNVKEIFKRNDNKKNMTQLHNSCIVVAQPEDEDEKQLFVKLIKSWKLEGKKIFGCFIIPFAFEGEKRKKLVTDAIDSLYDSMCTYKVIYSQNWLGMITKECMQTGHSLIYKLTFLKIITINKAICGRDTQK